MSACDSFLHYAFNFSFVTLYLLSALFSLDKLATTVRTDQPNMLQSNAYQSNASNNLRIAETHKCP